MKLFSIIFLFVFHEATSQTVFFPVDENGKFTFQEVVEVPEMHTDTLLINGATFMKSLKSLDIQKSYYKEDMDANSFMTKGGFAVSNYGSIKKHIGASVCYDILLEIKDGKYRYTINNFIITPYERNRYGKFVPENGKNIPLETEPSKLNSKSWNHYRREVYEKTSALIQNLNIAMVYQDKKETQKTNSDKDW